MTRLQIILLALLMPLFSTAQKLEGGFFLGGANYVGDLAVPDFFDLSETNFAFGLLIRNNFNERFALRGSLLFGKITGTDLNYTEPAWRQQRAYSFESPITEISLKLEFSPLTKDWYGGEDNDGTAFQRSWSPYVFAGIGGVFYDPTTDFNLTPGGNVPPLVQQDLDADYSSLNITFPLGLGVKFDISDKAVLGFEGGVRPPLTDYLDGVSESANPDKNDWYGFGGVTLTFRLSDDDRAPKTMQSKVLDADGDGVADENDLCPTTPGKAMFGGCPDSDNDGYADKDDPCPTLAGTLNGCPDSDGDGIADRDDRCPNDRGVASENGCPEKPKDSDGDGVLDAQDRCPTVVGLLSGCPDTDGDGIADIDDRCPNVRGIISENGCPQKIIDSDGDGVEDAQDRCPTVAGSTSNSGCPTISAADRAIIDLAIRNIRFETSSAILKTASYETLDQITDILLRYPSYNARISGHTDSVGAAASNLSLSEKRAKACYDYLVKEGIAASRLSHNGYGETRPIATNDSAEGRRINRRVEFELYLK